LKLILLWNNAKASCDAGSGRGNRVNRVYFAFATFFLRNDYSGYTVDQDLEF